MLSYITYIHAYFFSILLFLCSFDATRTNRLGRYANDAPVPIANCSSQFKVFKDVGPVAALFATRDINAGEELLYSYSPGGAHMPWRHG